ncbi:hypothetical protein CLAIMM_10124 [Cladophialophora immunda]|nr:hypothetical protein CLAIMM_10124 [Cladophialophora immunda]
MIGTDLVLGLLWWSLFLDGCKLHSFRWALAWVVVALGLDATAIYYSSRTGRPAILGLSVVIISIVIGSNSALQEIQTWDMLLHRTLDTGLFATSHGIGLISLSVESNSRYTKIYFWPERGSHGSQRGSSNGRHNRSGYGTLSSHTSSISQTLSSRTSEPAQWPLGQPYSHSRTPSFNTPDGLWPPLAQFDERQAVKIAIICALPKEADEVLAVFDRPGDDTRRFSKTARDKIAYTICSVGKQPVVVAHMPGAGKVNAAAVAVHLSTSFPDIRLALLVGICGGVPGGSDGSGDVR